MKQFPPIIFLMLVITGCIGHSGDIDPYTQKLLWLDAADPQADAQQALKIGDFRLLGLATRSVNIPGVEQEDSMKYQLKCGVQMIDGISDVVRSDEHLRLMQKARSYALKYNAIIKTRCHL